MENIVSVLGYPFLFWFGLILATLYGVCVGSFLNVVILRLPQNMSLSKEPSHCFHCGHKLKWYDNIPIVSYISLGGKCRYCKEKISIQYPLVEFANTILWVSLYLHFGWKIEILFYCILSSVLLALSIVDEKTFEIPPQLNAIVFFLGVVYTAIDYQNFVSHLVGMVCISTVLFLIWFFTDGMGFGDVKLVFGAGLLLGWKSIVVAFFVGCILAIVIHLVRMKLCKKEHKLAFGPYLSVGIFISLFCGEFLMNLYLQLAGFM